MKIPYLCMFQWNAVIKIKKESDLANVANLGSQTSEGLCQSLGLQVGDLLLMAAGRTLEAVSLRLIDT